MGAGLSMPMFVIGRFVPIVARNKEMLFVNSCTKRRTCSSSLMCNIAGTTVRFLAGSLMGRFRPGNVAIGTVTPNFVRAP